jgi:FAD dependent oxidoreductase TIGR03364
VACHRDEAVDVAGAFMRTDMAEGCRLFHKSDFSRLLGEFPETASLLLEDMRALLYSPLEMRVESRDAIPQLAQWLSEEKGIGFQWSTEVLHVEDGIVHTAKESIHADCIVVCPGAELTGIAKGAMEGYTTEQCTLQMLRIRPAKPIALPGSVMTDNSLARYHGWADLPEAAPLKKRIRYEMPEYLAAGIHLIAVQSTDGSLVLGDSHVYGVSESVFSSVDSDRLILNLAQGVVDLGRFDVIERWNGVYPVWAGGDAVIHRMSAKTVVTVVTSGTGASTAFGLAKDTFNTLE